MQPGYTVYNLSFTWPRKIARKSVAATFGSPVRLDPYSSRNVSGKNYCIQHVKPE